MKTNSGPSTLDSSASGLGSGSLAPERTENGQAPTPFWLSLESVPGGVAFPTSWKLRLGPDFDAFKSLFLKSQPGDPADFVPCPWNCGCFHKVVPQDNGTLLGLCQCAARACDDYTVLPEERIPLELDWTKLARLLCRAFGLQPKTVKLGLYHTLQIGAWSADALPVILTLASSRPEFLSIIAALIHQLGQPFILLAPTARHLSPAATELLASTGAAFFALQDHLICRGRRKEAAPVSRGPAICLHSSAAAGRGENSPLLERALCPRTVETERSSPSPPQEERAGERRPFSSQHPKVHRKEALVHCAAPQQPEFELTCATPPDQLFADVAPLHPDPSDEDLACRTFLALQQSDLGTRRKPPTIYTVFHLYCVQERTIPQIARQCHCSLGTVANRLALLRARTGVAPERLRRISPQFTKFENDFRQAQRNCRRPAH